ncbi:MAG: Lrp/AsnC family transcriptional regulator [Candidatus Omnitrophica bacterium]|nr:Lrp/AsnC family transcriptional regulator [Candidatus Omnitrophota bacterium]MBU1853476.1 Lrp/AsnC family transcriptional regulator [Candidatus Omnitrophota bacterium]
MKEILEILEKDARLTPEEISKTLKKSVGTVKKAIKKFEKDGVILKYKTIINRELVREETSSVRALIEVKIAPQRGYGFDHIAERIYRFQEVVSCYLLSGTYDLLLVVEGRDIHAVSSFVSERLATLDNVRGTVTHFLLKKYKEDGDILKRAERDKRIAISF